jgi:hypothetical protein
MIGLALVTVVTTLGAGLKRPKGTLWIGKSALTTW